jgi:preprotein translocase subunit SecE
MIEALISLLIVVIVVGIVAALIIWLIDMLPVDGRFKQIARVLVMVIAVLIILLRALPLLGVSV